MSPHRRFDIMKLIIFNYFRVFLRLSGSGNSLNYLLKVIHFTYVCVTFFTPLAGSTFCFLLSEEQQCISGLPLPKLIIFVYHLIQLDSYLYNLFIKQPMLIILQLKCHQNLHREKEAEALGQQKATLALPAMVGLLDLLGCMYLGTW